MQLSITTDEYSRRDALIERARSMNWERVWDPAHPSSWDLWCWWEECFALIGSEAGAGILFDDSRQRLGLSKDGLLKVKPFNMARWLAKTAALHQDVHELPRTWTRLGFSAIRSSKHERAHPGWMVYRLASMRRALRRVFVRRSFKQAPQWGYTTKRWYIAADTRPKLAGVLEGYVSEAMREGMPGLGADPALEALGAVWASA